MTFDDDIFILQVSGGMEYVVKYIDEDVIYMGVEWFYNQVGKEEINVFDLFIGQFQFFYSGWYYGAIFISLFNLGFWNDIIFVFFIVVNLSDCSMLLCIDVI